MKRTTSLLATSLLAATAALTAAASESAHFPAGTYATPDVTLAFDGNGHFRVTQKDAMKVEGDYAAHADRVKFTDRSGAWACPAAQVGTYRWVSKAGAMTFTKVSDACRDRGPSLTKSAWTRQK